MTSAEARFNKSLRPQTPEGSLGRTAQDVHLDSHTAPELCWIELLLVTVIVPPHPPPPPPPAANPPLLKSRQGPTVRLCRRVSTFYTDAGASEETNKPASNWRTCLREQRRRQEAHSKSPFPAAFSTNDISN